MDNKNPNNKNLNNLTPEELFKLMDAEKSDHNLDDLDDFDREALEGLKMVKNRDKVVELNSKIDALLEEEDKKKAVIIPLKNNRTLYYFAAAASVTLMVGLFFLFNPTNKETQLAVNDTSVLDQTTTNDKTTVNELSPEKPNSDAAIVEEKEELNKQEPRSEASGKSSNNGPVTTGTTAFAWKKDEVSKETDARENDLDQLKNGDIKTEEKNLGGYVNASPVMADEVTVPQPKALEQSVTTANNTANANYRNDKEDAKKKLSLKEAEKQEQVYYKNPGGGKDIAKAADSIGYAYTNLDKNAGLSTNQVISTTSTNSAIPAAGSGTTINHATNTITPNTTVLAKAELEEVQTKTPNKGFGNKKKASKNRSKTASFATGETKPNEKKATGNFESDEKANKIQNEIAVADDSKNTNEKSIIDYEGEVFTVVEQMPEYPGGAGIMMKYLLKSITIPEGSNITSSKVFVNFIVNKNGVVKYVKILSGLDNCKTCRDNVLKAFYAMPKWTPGKHNGEFVNVKMNVPLILDLK